MMPPSSSPNPPSIPPEFDSSDLADYLSGRASPEVVARMEGLEAVDPDVRALLERFRAIWGRLDTLPAALTGLDAQNAWGHVSEQMQAPATKEAARQSGGRTGVHWNLMTRAAAFIAVLVAVPLLWYANRGAQTHSTERSYATVTGQRGILTLRDGTQIILAPRSTVTLPSQFGVTTRRITLEGEGHFHVRASAGDPFVAQLRGAQVRVLGTTFVLRQYHADRDAHIAVVEGRVAVSVEKQRQSILDAGMIAVVSDSAIQDSRVDDISRYAAWTDGRLVFQDTPVPEVLATLGRWYGYQFHLADSMLAAKRLTVGLSTASSQRALQTLKLLLNIDVAIDSNVVTLMPRRSQSPKAAPVLDSQRERALNMEVGR